MIEHCCEIDGNIHEHCPYNKKCIELEIKESTDILFLGDKPNPAIDNVHKLCIINLAYGHLLNCNSDIIPWECCCGCGLPGCHVQPNPLVDYKMSLKIRKDF